MTSAYDRLPLNALRVFEAVATRLNFGAAAEALHVTPAAVSQQIKSLEDYLQTPLFRRNGRKVELTPEGAQLLPGVRRGLDELEATLQRLRTDRRSGLVNLSLLSSFLNKWLMPRLADLHERHPDVELRLHTSPDPVDFARTDFHAAIRVGPGNYPGLYVVKLMDEHVVAVAAPQILKKYGPLPEKGDLSHLPLLYGSDVDWASWGAGAQESPKTPRRAFIDDSAGLTVAATQGLGFALLRWSLIAGDIQAGRVEFASTRVMPFRYSYYFVCPEPYAQLPKVAKLREWFLEQARNFPAPTPIVRTRRRTV